MKRTVLFAISILLNISLATANSFYIQTQMSASLETNIFSYPLVQNANASYLGYRDQHPFFYRFDVGAGVRSNIFFSDRVGVSLGMDARFPVFSKSFRPTTLEPSWDDAVETGNWEYEKYDSRNEMQPFLAFSIGPVFRFKINGTAEIGLAIRPTINSYDLFESFEVGIQAEGFFNFIFEENYYFTFGLCYDAHLMKFVQSDTIIYEENYFALSMVPYVGFGLKLGD